MNPLNLVVTRRVSRGTVTVGGVRYFAAGLEMHDGEAVEIVVRTDGSAFADLGGAPLELTRIA